MHLESGWGGTLTLTEIAPINESPSLFFNYHLAFAESVLSIVASLVTFLPKNQLDSLPMTLAMVLTMWPPEIHYCIINLFCGYILPVLLGK